MRHLYSAARKTPSRLPDSSGARSVANARLSLAAIVAALFVVVAPLRAQKSGTSAASVPKASATAVPSKTVTTPAPSNDSYNLTVPSVLRDAPSSTSVGELNKTANVEVIAHDRGWSRVRIEGWVPDSVLAPADTSFRANLSAADLHADPVGSRGKMVVWSVEFLALQSADPLRHGLADDEPYLLARGPNSENALLYLVVPPSLMGTARALQPLSKLSVTARVRDGRSDPVGIPILDLQTIRRIK
jgi:hypothetical protein